MNERFLELSNHDKGNGIENESNPEKNGIFKAVIILGAGTRPDLEGNITHLSFDSKLRVLAGGTIASQGKAESIILTGGRTAGKDNPSEAEVMKVYLLKKFPELANFPITDLESSYDTRGNAKEVAEMLGDNIEGNILLITNGYHMLRAKRDFNKEGLKVSEISAESIVSQRSEHHERLIEEYLQSYDVKKKEAIEIMLRGIDKIDSEGRLLTALAKMLRHGEES